VRGRVDVGCDGLGGEVVGEEGFEDVNARVDVVGGFDVFEEAGCGGDLVVRDVDYSVFIEDGGEGYEVFGFCRVSPIWLGRSRLPPRG
jgi:hypothetical protein